MSKKKILVLTTRFPFPVVAGDSLRIYHICEELSKKYDLTLLSLCGSKKEMGASIDQNIFKKVHLIYLPKWKSYLRTTKAILTGEPLQLAYFWSEKFAAKVEELLPEFDLVLAHLIRAGQYVENKQGPKVLEMTDAISLNYNRVSNLGRKHIKHLIYTLESSRLKKYEEETIKNFDLVSLVAAEDKEFLLNDSENNESNIKVYTNGVDTDRLPYIGTGDKPVYSFIGNLRTVQNQDACEYFANEILPEIKKEIPEAIFRIVGSGPDEFRRKIEKVDGVETTGRVESIANAMKGSLCGIGIMRIGAGVQNKILEYMSLGIPVVSNNISKEGISIREGKEVLLGSSIGEHVANCIRIYEDPLLRKKMSQYGRKFVEDNHSWSEVLSSYVNEIDGIIS